MKQFEYLNPNIDLLKNDIQTAKSRILHLDISLIILFIILISIAAFYFFIDSHYTLDYHISDIYIPSDLDTVSDQSISHTTQIILGWLDGSLGTLISASFILVGIVAGLTRNSIFASVPAIFAAVVISNLGTLFQPLLNNQSIDALLSSERPPQEIYTVLSSDGHNKSSIDLIVAQLILSRHFSSGKPDYETTRSELVPYYKRINKSVPLDEESAQTLLSIEHFVKTKLVTQEYIEYSKKLLLAHEDLNRFTLYTKPVAILLIFISFLLVIFRIRLTSLINQARLTFPDQHL